MRDGSPTTFALTVDIEGEWIELPGEQGTFDLNRIIDAVHNLERLLERIESEIGVRIPVTWFIRCDDSVAATTGDASGLLRSLDSFIQRRARIGDGFGLHPHFYCLSQGRWSSETRPDKQLEQLERAAHAWKSYFGSMPLVSRMGEALMNNTLAAGLSKLGIEIDSSALPSRKRSDSGFQFDWSSTPAMPYRPALDDYRRPAVEGQPCQRFIEIPFSMLPINGPQDDHPIMRYCNLAFRPELVKSAAENMDAPKNVIAVVHPHELMLSRHEHPIIAHKPDALEQNIANLERIFGNLKFSLLTDVVAPNSCE